MNYENVLRVALSDAKTGKDMSRSAGEGIWANYVRATMVGRSPRDAQDFDIIHKAVVADLDSIKELSKEEKNSLRSAKCVVSKAVVAGIDVWQRDEAGSVIHDDRDEPLCKAKSDLQAAKSDFERMMAFIVGATTKYESDNRDNFTADELQELATAYATLSHSMIEDAKSQ